MIKNETFKKLLKLEYPDLQSFFALPIVLIFFALVLNIMFYFFKIQRGEFVNNLVIFILLVSNAPSPLKLYRLLPIKLNDYLIFQTIQMIWNGIWYGVLISSLGDITIENLLICIVSITISLFLRETLALWNIFNKDIRNLIFMLTALVPLGTEKSFKGICVWSLFILLICYLIVLVNRKS